MKRVVNICMLAVILVAMLLVSPVAKGQNNRLKIDDELFGYFETMHDHINDDSLFYYARLLKTLAVERGDQKAECIGQLFKMRYLLDHGTEAEWTAECEELKKISRNSDYRQFFYLAYQLEAKKYGEMDRLVDAVRVAREMAQEAYGEDSPKIYDALMLLGNFYYRRGVYSTALKEYTRALEFLQNRFPGRSLAPAYLACGKCRFLLGEYEWSIEMFDKCIACVKQHPTSACVAYQWKCLSLFYLMRIDEFRECYWAADEFVDSVKVEVDVEITDPIGESLEVIMLYSEGRKDSALVRLESVNFPTMARHGIKAKLYEYENRYDSAYYYFNSVIRLMSKSQDSSINNDIGSLGQALKNVDLIHQMKRLEYEKDRLELEKKQLAMDQAMLKLHNADLELEQERSCVELHTTQMENYDLERSRKKLQEMKQTLDNERHQSQLDNEVLRRLHIDMMLTIVIVVSVVLFLLFVGLFAMRNRSIVQLRKNNIQLEKARREAIEATIKAERSEQIKTLFLQNMSHDIRTPLNAICGFSQLIIDDEISAGIDEQEKANLADMIVNNTEMLTTLVNDILYVSDIGDTKYTIKMERHGVNEICRMAIKDVMYRKRAGVDLRLETSMDDDYTILTDRLRVQQILTNFLTNGIKHTVKGEICVECHMEEADDEMKHQQGVSKKIVFAVRNTGEPIPADKAKFIFGRFERLSNGVGTEGLSEDMSRSTGIGLSICRLISDQIGGHIWLDETYRDGARFVFEHPVRIQQA